MAQISPERLSISTPLLKPMSYTFTLNNQGKKSKFNANKKKKRKNKGRYEEVKNSSFTNKMKKLHLWKQ